MKELATWNNGRMGNLVSALDELAAENVRGVDVVSLGADLVELRRAVCRLEAEFTRRLAEFDRRGGAAAESLPTVAWLRHHCHLSHSVASARVGVARRLDELPVTAAAFAAGDVGVDHVRAVALVRDPAARAAVRGCEAELAAYARQVTPVEVARLVRHVVHAAEPEALAEDVERIRRDRWLSVSETFGGAYAIDGLLDPEAGATVRTALHALVAAGRHPGDERSPAQQRADALVELARHALDAGLPETAGERPHLTVTIALETLEARAGAPAATATWGGPIPGEAARRLACDAKISRVITAGASQPLDLGRTTRVVTPALRRALELRDRGCVWPGCDRPPAWTDAHHIRHWADGGPTGLTNLILLCRRHHRAVHEAKAPCPAPGGPSP